MNQTRFPRSSRQPQISKARFRPQLDFLEDRVLLTRAVFAVEGTQLRLSGTVGGVALQQQGVNSLVGSYRGMIEVDYDLTAGTIRFLPSNSTLTAEDRSAWQPLPNGLPGQAPASYGGRVVLFGEMAHGALRELTFSVFTAAPLPLLAATEGLLVFTSGVQVRVDQGRFAYNHPTFGYGATDLTALSATNTDPQPGFITDLGDGQLILGVPLTVSFSAVFGGFGATLQFTEWVFGFGRVQAETRTTVTSTPNPSVVGQPVTFTATVAAPPPATGTPTGTVSFYDGATALGSGTLNGAGQATFTTSTLAVGSHPSIQARYQGNANFSSSDSANYTHVVNRAASVVTLTSTRNPAVFSELVTFLATVRPQAPGAGTPTGTLTLRIGGTPSQTYPVSAGGTATFLSYPNASPTPYLLTAEYSGDSNFQTATSPVLSQVVNRARFGTSLTATPNPSVFGQEVVLTANLPAVPPVGFPTGDVTFRDGGTVLGTVPLASREAILRTTALTVGSHSLTATYNGNSNFEPTTSTVVTQTVNRAASRTTVTSAPNPSVVGQAVTFTATVSALAPGAGLPTGTVLFRDGVTPLGTATLAGGVATLSAPLLTAGSRSVTAVYNGDGNFTTSTSAPPLNHVVNRANSTATVVSSLNPSVYGQSVTFTATVSVVAPGAGTPTGTVMFQDNGGNIGTGTLTAAGTAAFTTSSLRVGAHPITAFYMGDNNFNSSTSPVLTQIVNPASTTTALTVSANPAVCGQFVTFTATVSAVAPGTGLPTGTVTFLNGGTTLGSATLSGGVARLTLSSLLSGVRSVTASYGGDSNFNMSTSAPPLAHTVINANTTTALSSSPNPSSPGQAVTFTATVSAVPPGSGVPAGTVTFLDGGASLGSASLSGGVARLTTSSLSVGNHAITAVYAGGGCFNGSSSGVLTQVVAVPAATRTDLVSSVNPSVFGQSVSFTATVSVVPPGTGTPTGQVTFRAGAVTLATVALSGSVARLTTSSLTVGTHSITASYQGSTYYNASASAPVLQTVGKAATTTALSSPANPAVYGQALAFQTQVLPVAPGAGTPTGTLVLKDGETILATGSVRDGLTTWTTPRLNPATHRLRLVYTGDDNFRGSSSTVVNQVVTPAGTRTTLAASANPSAFGQLVTFTSLVSTVAPGTGTPAGTVTFRDGAAVLGTVPLNATGQAVLSSARLTAGAHSLTATYSGSGLYQGSGSLDLTHTVSGGPAPVIWKGGAAGDATSWSNPGNWLAGVVPGAADVVLFTRDAFVGSFTAVVDPAFAGAVGTVVLDTSWNGTVRVQRGLTVANGLHLASGSWVGDAAVTVGGSSHWWGGTLTVGSGGLTNNGSLTVADAANVEVSAGGTLRQRGTFTNFASRTLTGGTYRIAGTFEFTNAALMVNAARLVLDGPASRVIDQNGSDALAGLAGNAAAGRLTLVNGREFYTFVDFQNAGTLTVGANSVFLALANYQQTGTIEVADTSLALLLGTFSNLVAGTLTGGTYALAGLFLFNGGAVSTNAADLVLDGGAALMLDLLGNNALANLAVNAPTGRLELRNGNVLATGGAFRNAGEVTLGAGSLFLASGAYTQTAGRTTLQEGYLSATGVGVDLQGGLLSGTGAILASVRNAARMDVGTLAGPGWLAILGDYTQTRAGILHLELGNVDSGQFDQLHIAGTAALDGTLAVGLLDSFFARADDVYPVLQFARRTGDFFAAVLPDLGAGLALESRLDATSLTLRTMARP